MSTPTTIASQILSVFCLSTSFVQQGHSAVSPVKSLNGTAVCGVGGGTLNLALTTEGLTTGGPCVPLLIRCALTCQRTAPNCTCFNYYTNGSCEFFSGSQSVSVSVQQGCTLWAATNATTFIQNIAGTACASSPCPSGATCVAGVNNYTCLCLSASSVSILPFECDTLAQSGHQSGVYNLSLLGNKPGYCEIQCGVATWLVFQRRVDGSINFYRNWIQFEKGFGNVSHEFWLGNAALANLTAARTYKLRVDLYDWMGSSRYAEYSNFSVGGAASNYTLASLGAYAGNAGDGLSPQLSMKWSTFDRDYDTWSSSCAVYSHGAWWYNDCQSSNLNGLYNSSNPTANSWYPWLGHGYSLKATCMKVRPAGSGY